jgi:APA family basic amino acid/polyamine antiporter
LSDSAEPRSNRTRGSLLKILGVGFGVAVVIGNTISAGIVRTPGEIAAWLPSVGLFLGVWILGGVYALLGANALAELGAMIPGSGGQYTFSRRALGNYAGFIVGWSDWLSTCGTTATVAVVIGEYAEVLAPKLTGHRVGVAVGVAVFFALLQWRGIRWGSWTQNLTSSLKGLGFVLLIAAVFLFGGGTAAAAAARDAGPPLVSVVLALQAVVYTYDGWSGPVYFSEELRNPGRDVPRALFLGCLGILGIYLLLNAALVYVLPLRQIAGDNFALGNAARLVFGNCGDTVVRSIMVLSMLAGINAYHLMATRVLFGLSRDGLFPLAAVRVNRGGTPSVALWVSAGVAVWFILWSGTFQRLIAMMSFFFVANYSMSFTSLFVLRWREPTTPRPFRAWGHPWTTGLALLSSLAFLAGAVAGDTENSLWTLVCLAASYPVYRMTRRAAA